ncbi:DUF2325 domain-containing protein [uncultured Methylobacterium sp.]|uniref:DUF2325 domain-containing protein n=1 Tax=uncultured Methylobacterium sp. TaxID=157278 RepID=UPI0035CC6844
MTHSPHIGGPALRALAAGAGRPAFVPPEADAAEKPRDRIWELADTLHCSIVGTCLTNAEARGLLTKLGRVDARTMTEHRLHGEIVQMAGRRDGGGRLLQKALDRRHEREIRRFSEARTASEVRTLWRASLERGEIPGAYWAAITHPATDWALVQDVFGEVHMLSHLVGQSNRADIRRLRQLEADLAERDAEAARQERRILELMEQRDALGARNRMAEAACAVPASARHGTDPVTRRDTVKTLEGRLAREQAHAEALEEKVAILMQASSRLSRDLDAEVGRSRALEAEVLALESALDAPTVDAGMPAADPACLKGKTFLYVGGRPRQVANLRRFTTARGGRLLSHDGGVEESLSLLPGLVGQSDLVLFPVACVSHEATAWVKRSCGDGAKPFRLLRSASLASYVHAVLPGSSPAA